MVKFERDVLANTNGALTSSNVDLIRLNYPASVRSSSVLTMAVMSGARKTHSRNWHIWPRLPSLT